MGHLAQSVAKRRQGRQGDGISAVVCVKRWDFSCPPHPPHPPIHGMGRVGGGGGERRVRVKNVPNTLPNPLPNYVIQPSAHWRESYATSAGVHSKRWEEATCKAYDAIFRRKSEHGTGQTTWTGSALSSNPGGINDWGQLADPLCPPGPTQARHFVLRNRIPGVYRSGRTADRARDPKKRALNLPIQGLR